MRLTSLPELPDRPLVSVLIPSYNYARYVGDAIESVLQQTYPDFEIIVCDDGSTDNSVEVIATFGERDQRVRPLWKRNGGQASAFNAAFQNSKGDIVCTLDADDLFEPTKLEHVVRKFAQNPDCGFVIHFVSVIDSKGHETRRLTYRDEGSLGKEFDTLRTKNVFPPCSGLCFRRQVLEEAFPLPEHIRIDADGIMSDIASFVTETRVIPFVLSKWRIHGGNNASNASMLLELNSEWLERRIRTVSAVREYAAEIARNRYSLPIGTSRFRPLIEYRLALAVLKGDRRLSRDAAANLMHAFRTARRDYGYHRLVLFLLLARLPNAISKRVLAAAFRVFKYLNNRGEASFEHRAGRARTATPKLYN